MKIRTQFIVTMAVFGAVLLAISASVVLTNQEVERLNGQLEVAIRIERDASELSYLWNDYLLYRESQLRARWEAKFAAFSADVASLALDAPEERVLVDNIRANQRRLQAVFADVASTLEGTSRARVGEIAQAFIEDSWSRMAVQNQGIFFDASRLSQVLRERVDQAKQTNILLIFALLAVFGAYFVTNYLLVYRHTLRSIRELQAGTKVIGSGDLDVAIAVRRDDEVGELSRAFNLMAASLKRVTASKAELEREIGERKRAEDERERLLEEVQRRAAELDASLAAIADGLVIYGLRGEIVRMNAVAEEILGFPPEERELSITERLGGHHYYETADGKPAPIEELPQSRALHGEVVPGEMLGFRRPGRAVRWLTISAAPIRTADGEHLGAVSNFADVTALRELEEQREDFIRAITHDLRNPLTAVLGTAQLLDRVAERPEAIRKQSAVILGNARRMSAMLGDLVDSLRIGAGRMTPSLQPVSLPSLVLEVVNRMGDAEGRGRIRVEPPEHLPSITADPGMLERVLTNLLSNALKYGREGTSVVVRVVERSGEVVVSVKDEGPGIATEHLPLIFDRYYRVASDEKRRDGLGLGLYITQGLVEAMGGRIWVASEVGKGSTFSFSLPA